MTASKQRSSTDIGARISALRAEIVLHGSSWGALQLALATTPTDLPELLTTARVFDLRGQSRVRAFDACVDGYGVFHDARRRGKL